MQDMNDHHHLVADETVVEADVIEVDAIDPESEDDQEAMIVEEVDRVADQIDEAVIEAEKEEVDPIVGQIVTDQTVVAGTTNQHPNPDPVQNLDPHPDRKLSNCPFLSDAKV